MTFFLMTHDSPLGALTLVSNGAGLSGLYFEDHKIGGPPAGASVRGEGVLDEARRQLDAYFAGRRARFDLPLALAGTPFQTRVWAALRRIPFGRTSVYGALASDIGNPAAARAVGAAVGRNPVSIIVPCHRVIGAQGALTGFAGGLKRKAWLLEHEQLARANALT
ncbi:MAG: methylated-DNA--[protein]-cysteine S-methyltransferase [Hyphomonadaceae bacterium]